MKKLNLFSVSPLALAVSLASASAFAPVVANAGVSGNIGVFSQYVLRGITNTPEDSNAALQGGFDWSNDAGWYLGYWGSSLGYSTEQAGGDGFENDFYGGYGGSMGDISYSLGLIQYYYVNVDNSDLTELTGGLGYGPVSFGFKYLLNDGAWGNNGDIYWTLGYSTDLPAGFSLGATLGWYTYDDSANADMCGAGVPGNVCTTEDTAFRHLDVSLSHPIGNTGADMSLTYTHGGKNRASVDQKDAVVFGVKYGFDL